MPEYQLSQVHCIGIGGIGVSAIARLLLELGSRVSGSDVVSSSLTDELQSRGAKIHIGRHRAANVPQESSLVIHSNAVPGNNPELVRAKSLRIPVLSYPEFLGWYLRSYIPIVVSGTHGKSTTTAMLGQIFLAAGADPTIIVGTKMSNLQSNVHVGLGKYCIVEGDEYRAAFRHYDPVGLVVTNIEADHLDYYKNLDDIIKTFNGVVKKIPKHGCLVASATDRNVTAAVRHARCRVITFGIGAGDYQATHIIRHGELTRFSVRGAERFDLAIRLPGDHNVANALGAAVMALQFGIGISSIQKGLLEFAGSWRRFEVKGTRHGVTFVDDYAHHPTEIRATLRAARQFFPGRSILCVFQPHTRNRTRRLLPDFARSFADCDTVALTDIYTVAGREGKEKISIGDLVRATRQHHESAYYTGSVAKTSSWLRQRIRSGDVVITMGAGDITKLSDQLLS